MDFRTLPVADVKKLADLMFQPLSSAEEVKDWARLYLALELPLEITDPDSTSSPLDAIWQVYKTFKDNTGDKNPGYIMMSCREGMKCSIQGTRIIKKNGFEKIENVKKGDLIWTGFSWQKVTETFDEGLKPGLQVNVDGGHRVTGTPIHRYWCLRDGTEQWIAGKDLNRETDLICLNVDTGLAKIGKPTDQEKYDIGYFLGLLTGDGGLTLLDSYKKFTLTNTDAYILDFYKKFAAKYFPDNKLCSSKDGIEYTTHGQKNIDLIKEWGLSSSYSWEKKIPSFAWDHIDAMKGFIAGVFDTDGCWDKKGDSFFEMTCGPMLDQMQIAFTALGIECRVRHNKKLYGLQKHLVSRLTIGQTESAKFEKLGIVFKAKKAQGHKPAKVQNAKDAIPRVQLDDLFEIASRHTSRSIKNRKYKKPNLRLDVPYTSVTYVKIQQLIDWLYENHSKTALNEADLMVVKRYEKILLNKWKNFTVEDVGKQYFYDLTVENEHSYWSNGLISHNTVSVAILEILLLLHFQLDIGHAAAVETQSYVALQYIGGFILNIQPLLDAAGWIKTSENKRLIKYTTPQNKQPFIKVVICSPKGMNSLHSNVLFLDELDLADPKALKEAKNIVGYSKGIHGVTVYLSTRKYAFGNMAKAIEEASSMNYNILRWNILDVTEVCPPSRHLPEGLKEDRYVAKNLPLLAIPGDEYNLLPDSEKLKFDLVKDAHQGCLSCILLPVCRMRLSTKPLTATGGFYKPITTVTQKFRENDADTAEAQLMCWKPGSEGLVYPRFISQTGKGNVLGLKAAYETLTGEPTTKNYVSHMELIQKMQEMDIPFYAGVDWGFTHDSTIIIAAMLPSGEVWIVDCFAAPGLEFSDVLAIAISYRDKYKVAKWFLDTAQPAFLKTFNKNAMKSPNFKKDVMAGIESIRSKIVDSTGKRKFKILDTTDNRKLITAIIKHRFKLDGQGNLTMQPDDERGVADLCDALRYIGQNLFPVKGTQKIIEAWTNGGVSQEIRDPNPTHASQMAEEVGKRISDSDEIKGGTGKKGGFHYNF